MMEVGEPPVGGSSSSNIESMISSDGSMMQMIYMGNGKDQVDAFTAMFTPSEDNS